MRSFSNPLTEYSPQMELASDLLQEFDGESEHGSFDAHQEMQLAIRLLEVADEEHLERFLDDLISQAGSETGNPSGSRVGQAMRRVVKTVIGQALAPGGAAIAKRRGGFLGAQLGCGLAAVSGEVLGLELEGLSGEDREFEAIRQFVRFAGTAARIAAGAAAAGDASAVAHRAAVEAARLHAPGLLIGGSGWRRAAGDGVPRGRIPLSESGSTIRHRRRRMHDIDRTQFGYGQEMESFTPAADGTALSESEEMQLAAELMELQTEEEFENFLTDLISSVAHAAGGFLNSAAGKALGGLLKGAAKKLLPVAGTAIGGYFGGPLGASLGGNIAGSVAGALEMEADEMEWEAARTFVRLAADAARNAALSPEGEAPEDTAHQAVGDAAQKHAPMLIAPPPVPQPAPPVPAWPGAAPGHRGGRWVRHGNRIVLFGV